MGQKKKARIAYSRLIRGYEQGGLKLVDLEKKNIAMKTKWIQLCRKGENATLNSMMSSLIPIEAKLMAQCNLSCKDIKKCFEVNVFSDILQAWSNITYGPPTSKNEVENQVIWMNSYIKINDRLIMYKLWHKKGLNKVGQLFGQNRELKTYEQIQHEYGQIVSFIDINNVYNAIPKEWKRYLTGAAGNKLHKSGIELVGDTIKCSAIVYKHLIDQLQDKGTAKTKWEKELNFEINDNKWSKKFNDTKKLTLCTKLRFFQYRLLHRYLTTNVRVALWDTNVTNLCTFCKEKEETYLHLFVHCKHVKKLWDALAKWLNNFCFIQVNFSEVIVIFNEYKEEFADLVNTICLIVKYFIYVQKCYNQLPTFPAMIQAITQYKCIEMKAAYKIGIAKKIKHKWCMYDMI